MLSVGDVVFVVTDQRGAALLAQLPQAQSALVAMDPADGAIVSLVGGFDFYRNKFNRATQARRQPGSGFKPFLYSAALDNGFTPATVSPWTCRRCWIAATTRKRTGGRRIPARISANRRGLREALVRSRNLVSIRVVQGVGPEAVLKQTAKFRVQDGLIPEDAVAGAGHSGGLAAREATGFTVFANGGFKVEPYYISRIEDSSGRVLFEAEPKLACRRASRRRVIRC
ncbi:MAG: hypothetical protein IPM70_18725 [Proteobacteria bacterium]|nr:hypothetical protein [Pseudomonadota bacterium]